MKIVMELMTTVRLLTDSNTPAYMRMVYKIRYIMHAYLALVVVLGYFPHLIMDSDEKQYM